MLGLILIDTRALREDPARVPSYMQMVEVWVQRGFSGKMATNIGQAILGAEFPGTAAWKTKWEHFRTINLRQIFNTLVTRDDISGRLAEIRVPALRQVRS